MESKIHSYESDEIKVTYDLNRCIHAKECVKGLPNVFDPNKRPWIQPEHAKAENIMDVVRRCPTGALQYEAKNADQSEPVPKKNTISIVPNGPVYFRGNIEVQDQEGNVMLNDTRFALCRCGKSSNKPACDNSHTDVDFEAHASFDTSTMEEESPKTEGEKLVLKMQKDGPVLINGSYQIYSETAQPVGCSDTIALCRCGGSDNKPFCDGTHKQIGFTS